MDAAARKSYEIQAQVRHNAQTYQDTLKDLQSWEREIKEKESSLQKSPEPPIVSESIGEANDLKSLPVRSYLFEKSAETKKQSKESAQQTKQNKDIKNNSKNVKNTAAVLPNEKRETESDPAALKRMDANDMKEAGNRHVKFQQYDLAIKEYSAAIDLCPHESVYFSNRALCYLKLERYDKCVEDCDRAIGLDKLAVKAYYRRMQANESLGNYMDALKDCTTALTIEPRNVDAKKSLERINERIRKNFQSKNGPNFSPDNENFIEIQPIDKPPYKRSTKPLRRVPIADVVGPKASKTFQNLQISDDDIEKLFNSNCGPFVEVKKSVKPSEENEAAMSLSVKVEEKIKELPETTISSDAKNLESKNSVELKEVSDPVVASSSAPLLQKESVKPIKVTDTSKKIETSSCQKRELPPPSSSAQFYTNWKELSDKQKYQYLSSIDLNILRKVLGAGFDSDTLSDCLRVLRDYFISNNDATTAATLLEISRNEEIAILSLLMSNEDKQALLEVLDSLERKKLINQETMATIKRNFNLL